jgi:hypothetical protein
MALPRLPGTDHRRLRPRRLSRKAVGGRPDGVSRFDFYNPLRHYDALGYLMPDELIVFDRVVPVRDDVVVVRSPLHHALADEFVGP